MSHTRLTPKRHSMAHGGFWFAFDLEELGAGGDGARRLQRLSWGVYRFRATDYLDGLAAGPADLKSRFLTWYASSGDPAPAGARVTLVTLPRVLGYVFNPVSFYFVSDAEGRPMGAAAEVGNTFGERKMYRIPRDPASPDDAPSFRRRVEKHFYVSPYSPLDFQFDFRLRPPGGRLDLGVNTLDASGTPVLIAGIQGRRRPLGRSALAWLTLRYPLMTARVIVLIHWHALRLWMKQVPWRRKSSDPGLQRDLCHPAPGVLPSSSAGRAAAGAS